MSSYGAKGTRTPNIPAAGRPGSRFWSQSDIMDPACLSRAVQHFMKTLKGSCLCGSVAFEVTGKPFRFLYCHCRSCQKSSGSVHVVNLGFPLDSVSWTRGADLIGRFVDDKDNPGFTRCFCRHCGSVLPKLTRNQKFWVVQSGLLDSYPEMRPQANIFSSLLSRRH
jgi:hypothetical protein